MFWLKTSIFVLLVAAGLSNVAEEPVSYLEYQVIEVSGLTNLESEEEFLTSFGLPFDQSLEIIHADATKGSIQVLVPPEERETFVQKVEERGLTTQILIQDVGWLMRSRNLLKKEVTNLEGKSTFERFMSLEEIDNYLNEIPKTFPNKVKVSSIGKSFDEKDIKMVTITNDVGRSHDRRKPIIFIESGVHSREWISVSSALYMIDQLLKSRSLMEEVEWRIVPVVNPDGYKYSWEKNRFWRKNRSIKSYSGCIGVDLNRNFDSYWRREGTSSSACSSNYGGKNAFSESETVAVKDTVLQAEDRVKAYISLHSYGQYILYPPGGSFVNLTDSALSTLESVASKMAEAIREKAHANYTFGSPKSLLYPASGLSMDWALFNAKIPFSYTFELRDQGEFGFILSDEEINDAVQDVWIAMSVLYDEVRNLKSAGSGSSCKSCSFSLPTAQSSSSVNEIMIAESIMNAINTFKSSSADDSGVSESNFSPNHETPLFTEAESDSNTKSEGIGQNVGNFDLTDSSDSHIKNTALDYNTEITKTHALEAEPQINLENNQHNINNKNKLFTKFDYRDDNTPTLKIPLHTKDSTLFESSLNERDNLKSGFNANDKSELNSQGGILSSATDLNIKDSTYKKSEVNTKEIPFQSTNLETGDEILYESSLGTNDGHNSEANLNLMSSVHLEIQEDKVVPNIAETTSFVNQENIPHIIKEEISNSKIKSTFDSDVNEDHIQVDPVKERTESDASVSESHLTIPLNNDNVSQDDKESTKINGEPGIQDIVTDMKSESVKYSKPSLVNSTESLLPSYTTTESPSTHEDQIKGNEDKISEINYVKIHEVNNLVNLEMNENDKYNEKESLPIESNQPTTAKEPPTRLSSSKLDSHIEKANEGKIEGSDSDVRVDSSFSNSPIIKIKQIDPKKATVQKEIKDETQSESSYLTESQTLKKSDSDFLSDKKIYPSDITKADSHKTDRIPLLSNVRNENYDGSFTLDQTGNSNIYNTAQITPIINPYESLLRLLNNRERSGISALMYSKMSSSINDPSIFDYSLEDNSEESLQIPLEPKFYSISEGFSPLRQKLPYSLLYFLKPRD